MWDWFLRSAQSNDFILFLVRILKPRNDWMKLLSLKLREDLLLPLLDLLFLSLVVDN